MEFWGSTVNPRMPVASVRGPSGQDTVGTQEGAGVCNSPEDRKLPRCVSHSGILLAFSLLAGAQPVEFCPSVVLGLCVLGAERDEMVGGGRAGPALAAWGLVGSLSSERPGRLLAASLRQPGGS